MDLISIGWTSPISLVVDIDEFCESYGTHIYEFEDGTVKDTFIQPELNVCEYHDIYEQLIETEHQRYCPRKILDLREKIAQI